MTGETGFIMPEAEIARQLFDLQVKELHGHMDNPNVSPQTASWRLDKFEALNIEPPERPYPVHIDQNDLYVDTALALGTITKEPVSQDQLFLLVAARQIARLQASRANLQQQFQAVQTKALFYVMDLFESHPFLVQGFEFERPEVEEDEDNDNEEEELRPLQQEFLQFVISHALYHHEKTGKRDGHGFIDSAKYKVSGKMLVPVDRIVFSYEHDADPATNKTDAYAVAQCQFEGENIFSLECWLSGDNHKAGEFKASFGENLPQRWDNERFFEKFLELLEEKEELLDLVLDYDDPMVDEQG